jgi:hypothetical protein
MGVLLVCDNCQGLTLHIKWSINGGWEICNVWILLTIDSFVFSQYRQWTPLNKPIHKYTTVKIFKKSDYLVLTLVAVALDILFSSWPVFVSEWVWPRELARSPQFPPWPPVHPVAPQRICPRLQK